MTKKQAGIICTLLALIVCTALLAVKLNNGGLNDPTDLSAIITTENNNDQNGTDENSGSEDTTQKETDKETIGEADFFYNARSEREQSDALLTQNLKSIIENENTSKEQKDEANAKLEKIALRQEKQRNIELNIKNKGYQDALCEISENDDKANIIIKSTDKLTEKQGAVIQEIVQNVSNIKEVTIEYKN